MLKVSQEQLIQEVNDLVAANNQLLAEEAQLTEARSEYDQAVERAAGVLIDAEREAAAIRANAEQRLNERNVAYGVASTLLANQVKYLQQLVAGAEAGDDPTPVAPVAVVE